MVKKRKIFLDFASATPVDKSVAKLAFDIQKKYWHNPSSIHSDGVIASKILKKLRKEVADVLYAHDDEIIFTSGGTEANNLAISGFAKGFKEGKAKILVCAIDHSSIIEQLKSLSQIAGVSFLPVHQDGLLDMKAFKNALTKKPHLISFGLVNGEIGTKQDLKEIMKAVRHHRKLNKTNYPYVHIDATQAVNVYSCEVNKLGIDLMTLDGTKIYGPKGIGMLFIKRGTPIEPIIVGGGQEGGFRSGTENLASIAGFSKALALAQKNLGKTIKLFTKFNDSFLNKLDKQKIDYVLNSPSKLENKHPGIINICFPHINSEQAVLIMDSYGVSVSASTSCQSLVERSNSYVVEALGKNDCAHSSIRFSFGRDTQKSDFDYVIKVLKYALDGSTGKKLNV